MVTANQALGILSDKHLLICGGTESERLRLARSVVESAMDSETDLYELPAGISTIEHYLRAVQEIFPILSPIEYLGWLRKLLPFLPTFRMPKGRMNLDQVNDIQLDWVGLCARSLIFWPEAGFGEDMDAVEVLSRYVTGKFLIEDSTVPSEFPGGRIPWFRLVLTSAAELSGIERSVSIQYSRGEADARTDSEVVWEHLGLIDLGERESGEGGTEGVF